MNHRILVSYSMLSTHTQTTLDYLNSFKALSASVDYLHVTDYAVVDVCLSNYDVVINSYCARLCFDNYVANSFVKKLKRFSGLKVLAVQDEYNRTDTLKRAIKDIGFDVVLTCVPQDSLDYVYPRTEFPRTRFETVFTGYVPDYLADSERLPVPLGKRPIVVGYRGRDIGGVYGRLAFDKLEIGRRMKEICSARGIPHDIAMDEESRIYGPAWFDFIGSCRSMLGTESGSNVFDFDGSLERRFKKMTERLGHRPSYAEFEPYVAQREREISMGQISPRVFECVAMRTPMVLFRGRYSDAIEPEVHYIPLEKDFSNVDDVLARLERLDELEAMADRAYEHIVASGRFGYRAFAQRLTRIIEEELARRSPVIRTPDPEPVRSVVSGQAPWQISRPTKEPQPRSAYYLMGKKSYFVLLRDEVAQLEKLTLDKINRCLNVLDGSDGNQPSSDEKSAVEGLRQWVDESSTRVAALAEERAAVSQLAAQFADLTSVEEMDRLLEIHERQINALRNICVDSGAGVLNQPSISSPSFVDLKARALIAVVVIFRCLPTPVRHRIATLLRFASNRLPARFRVWLATRFAYLRFTYGSRSALALASRPLRPKGLQQRVLIAVATVLRKLPTPVRHRIMALLQFGWKYLPVKIQGQLTGLVTHLRLTQKSS